MPMSKFMNLLVEDDASYESYGPGLLMVECPIEQAAELIIASTGTELRAPPPSTSREAGGLDDAFLPSNSSDEKKARRLRRYLSTLNVVNFYSS